MPQAIQPAHPDFSSELRRIWDEVAIRMRGKRVYSSYRRDVWSDAFCFEITWRCVRYQCMSTEEGKLEFIFRAGMLPYEVMTEETWLKDIVSELSGFNPSVHSLGYYTSYSDE